MTAEEILNIRRAAFAEAVRIAMKSDTAHNNGTGHYRGGWHDARRDIADKIERHIATDKDRIEAAIAAS